MGLPRKQHFWRVWSILSLLSLVVLLAAKQRGSASSECSIHARNAVSEAIPCVSLLCLVRRQQRRALLLNECLEDKSEKVQQIVLVRITSLPLPAWNAGTAGKALLSSGQHHKHQLCVDGPSLDQETRRSKRRPPRLAGASQVSRPSCSTSRAA